VNGIEGVDSAITSHFWSHLGPCNVEEKVEDWVETALNAWGLLGSRLKATDRNRRVSSPLSPIFSLLLAPSGTLYLKVQDLLAHDETHDVSPPAMGGKRRPGPKHPP
jgi:hypothetical protein